MNWWKSLKSRFRKKPEVREVVTPTQEQWDQIADIDWEAIGRKATIMVENLHPLRCEGEKVVARPAGPRSYSSFAGTEIKGYLRMKNGKYVCFPELQGVWYKYSYQGNKTGQLRFVVFDISVWDRLQDPNIKDLVLFGANEYNSIGQMELLDISFDEIEGGYSINSIVTEETIDFHFQKLIAWRLVDALPRDNLLLMADQ